MKIPTILLLLPLSSSLLLPVAWDLKLPKLKFPVPKKVPFVPKNGEPPSPPNHGMEESASGDWEGGDCELPYANDTSVWAMDGEENDGIKYFRRFQVFREWVRKGRDHSPVLFALDVFFNVVFSYVKMVSVACVVVLGTLKEHLTPLMTAVLGLGLVREPRSIIRNLCIFFALQSTLSMLCEEVESRTTRMTPSLNDYALVTGASSGIGEAISTELALQGYNLVLVARRRHRLEDNAKRLRKQYGVYTKVFATDLTDMNNVEDLYRMTSRENLTVSVLVNSAGACRHGSFIDSNYTTIADTIQLNAYSLTRLCHLYGADMVRNRRGRILNIASVCASASQPNLATYGATKAYVASLSGALRREMERYGVGVTYSLPAQTTGEFASKSNLGNALCFRLPKLQTDPHEVARQSLSAMHRNQQYVVPGVFAKFYAHVMGLSTTPYFLGKFAELGVTPVKRGNGSL